METILRPKALVLPHYTTAVRDTLHSEVGSIIYDDTTNKLCFCIASAANAASWLKLGTAN
jgi:hypothetical protein